MVKYSFVLPAYKARFFREAIESILNQTYSEFELIIVNDASPEDLDSIVNSYSDERIRYYRNKENIGGRDIDAVSVGIAVFHNGQGDNGDIIFFNEFLGKIAGAVRCDLNVHIFLLFVWQCGISWL